MFTQAMSELRAWVRVGVEDPSYQKPTTVHSNPSRTVSHNLDLVHDTQEFSTTRSQNVDVC